MVRESAPELGLGPRHPDSQSRGRKPHTEYVWIPSGGEEGRGSSSAGSSLNFLSRSGTRLMCIRFPDLHGPRTRDHQRLPTPRPRVVKLLLHTEGVMHTPTPRKEQVEQSLRVPETLF